MSKARGLVAAISIVAMLIIPAPAASQELHDIEFHALFPGELTASRLECAAGERTYDPLRAGRWLELTDEAGASVGTGLLENVASPSRDGMCESRVMFIRVPDAPAYFVRSAAQTITSRTREELEASGWVITSMFGTQPKAGPQDASSVAGSLPATEFGTYVADALERIGARWVSVGAEMNLGEVDRAIGILDEIVTFSTNELTWLAAHPPGDCYRPLHEDLRQAFQMSSETASVLRSGLSDWDTDLLDQGIAMLASTTDVVGATTQSIDQMVRECPSGSVEAAVRPQKPTPEATKPLPTPRPTPMATRPPATPRQPGMTVNLKFTGKGFNKRVKGFVPTDQLDPFASCEWGSKPGSQGVKFVTEASFDGKDVGVPRLTNFFFDDLDGPGRLKGTVYVDVARGFDTLYYAWDPTICAPECARGTIKYRNSYRTVVFNIRLWNFLGSGYMTAKGKLTCTPPQ